MFGVDLGEDAAIGGGGDRMNVILCRNELVRQFGVELSALRLDIGGHGRARRILKVNLLAVAAPGDSTGWNCPIVRNLADRKSVV